MLKLVTNQKIDHRKKNAKIWLVKFCMVKFKIVYPAQFSADLSNRDLKIHVRACSIKTEKNEIKQNKFCSIVDQARYFFGPPGTVFLSKLVKKIIPNRKLCHL